MNNAPLFPSSELQSKFAGNVLGAILKTPDGALSFWHTLIPNGSSAMLALILVNDFKELEDGPLRNMV